MLVAISECDSLCRPRHSICLQLLIKPIAYVHPGIPSYPSVKSPLLLPLLLPLPIPTSFPFPPSLLTPSHLPPFLIAPLSIRSPHLVPLPIANLFPSLLLPSPSPPPHCPLPDSPPPSCHPPLLPVHPSPPPTSHSPPRFRPLPAPQHPFPHCPSAHRQQGH